MLQSPHWKERLQEIRLNFSDADGMEVSGRIVGITGLVMEAVGIELPIGCSCEIPLNGGRTIEAEVVGFNGDRTLLMPHGSLDGVIPGARVFELGSTRASKAHDELHIRQLPVGNGLLGRVVDASGRPLDDKGDIAKDILWPLVSKPINPLTRAPIDKPLDVGVRAINALLTVGRGQRMGLFAGSGVGKSVLLGMMARYTDADVIVVGLIGERGREVQEFIEQILGEEGLARSVVVAAPADEPALMRLQGASYTTAIAEYFRAQGKNVLLIMDSLTRFAMAQREIALAVGEPPATKGYPPSVFAKLPALVERTGNGKPGEGSITAFYTVLTEGDDQQDPIADSARAILDGHIVLSRKLAESGHYPAIDIEQSISRAMHNITEYNHQLSARRMKQLLSAFNENRELVTVGAYQAGSSPIIDEAISAAPRMAMFLQQDINERSGLQEAISNLEELWR